MIKIIEALRAQKQVDADGVMCIVSRQACDEAADMLQFFFGQLQMHSPKMNGQHSYRFRGSGWPMTHCRGPNAEDAVRAAVQEVARSRIDGIHPSE